MPTKTDPGSRMLSAREFVLNTGSTPYEYKQYFNSGRNSITYGSGRKLPDGNWPWKPCEHSFTNVYNGKMAMDAYCYCATASHLYHKEFGYKSAFLSSPDALGKDPGWDSSVTRGILNQLDLNKGESCLIYANVVQALPFLGAATRLASTLNQAARQFKKDLRKKPFTTAVKSLISADFVDRFVISPTIDDARKFATATNYVVNKLEVAKDRNSHPFALESELNTVFKDREESSSSTAFSNDIGWRYKYRRRYQTRAVDKAYALLEASYTTDELTPLRLWANRTGFSKPLDSAWDLVPFSFVLDYFFKAGDFIAGVSEEMAADEGLRGTITRIHGLWGSHLYESTVETSLVEAQFENRLGYYPVTLEQHCYSDFPVVRSGVYKRFPVSNPWSYLFSLAENYNDYISVNVDLSSTRKRTLAELVIQAKL